MEYELAGVCCKGPSTFLSVVHWQMKSPSIGWSQVK